MDRFGINFGFLFFQLFNILILIISPILSIIVLFSLRKRDLGQTAKALWVLISFVPIIGPIAFWIVNPQAEIATE